MDHATDPSQRAKHAAMSIAVLQSFSLPEACAHDSDVARGVNVEGAAFTQDRRAGSDARSRRVAQKPSFQQIARGHLKPLGLR
eukprot:7017730-Pyramimonas_sp.AAC.1